MDRKDFYSGINQSLESIITDSDAKVFENVNNLVEETINGNIETGFKGYKNLGSARAGGYAVEQMYAETLNANAKLNGFSSVANAIDDNGLADIYVGSQKYQLKFLKTPSATMKEISQTFGDHYKSGSQRLPFEEWKQVIAKKFGINPNRISRNTSYYEGMRYVVPSDQLNQIKKLLNLRIESARNVGNNIEAERLTTIRAEVTDVISDENGNQSIKFTKAMANEMGKNGRLSNEARELLFEKNRTAILKGALKSGMTAAMLSFTVQVAPCLLEMIATKQVDLNELEQKSKSGSLNATQSFLVTSISSWLSQTGNLLQNTVGKLTNNQISAVVLLMVNMIKSVEKFSSGKISSAEMSNQISHDMFVTGTTLLGMKIAGSMIAPELVIPMILAELMGSIIGSVIGSKVFDYGNSVFLGLSAKYGWTAFGIVDQNYRLSDEDLKEMGLDVISFDELEFNDLEFDEPDFDEPNFDEPQFDEFNVRFIRRGVIGMANYKFNPNKPGIFQWQSVDDVFLMVVD
ncbi:hypothetical protein [Levilactobacillus namurensis]|uniref:Uncharacterized protein n=1 Tax=Levilactobacillus namurensis TaxID=380393 RepID=A0AAW8W4P8_9LACO|nr:hypothetical protein [Levilactobacillus namurensis]MDT7013718.1 hypothetical protein [Levilactobacillus namurensis]